MPSPFPGMDPYLEDPEFFPDLHDGMIGQLRTLLQILLPDGYYCQIRSRVCVAYREHPFEPDLNVLRVQKSDAGSTALLEPAVDVTLESEMVYLEDEEHENWIEIHTVHGERPLVTAIEILSPSNKLRGSGNRDSYLRKQREYLQGKANLVEIDLLRGGAHTTAIPLAYAIKATGGYDYHVCVRRAAALRHCQIYPIRLEKPLPQVAIPLSPGDKPIVVDLQAAFDAMYAAGPYRKLPIYSQRKPEPPLSPEKADWALRLLIEKGYLPAQ